METLREKIGQMFLVGCQGETLTHNEQLIFAEYQFGGVILFKRNCAEPAQLLNLCQSLWESAVGTPPFIAIDQEGGSVHRLPEPFTHFPAAARIGEKGNIELARRLGRAAAEELKLAGINLNFAPVLDVNSNPANPIIGARAFGATPKQVIEISSAWTQGLRDGGIIPCGKHFPGHGDTDKDSHIELPTVRKTLDELKTVELPPFDHACRNQIESLMVAHVLYPALDPNLPATLSEPIVTGLLRHQLGYDGVVFSDDMEMKAICDNYGVEQATALAVRAGVDVLLFCHEVEKAMQAFEFLCNEVERDPAVRARVEESHRRITELKQLYLKDFTGVAQNEIAARLVEVDHRRLIDEFYGNLYAL
jgi:beta-N-acetylhexosaminidase